MNLSQTIAPEDLGKAREMLNRKLAGEKGTAYEMEILAKDGHRGAGEGPHQTDLHDHQRGGSVWVYSEPGHGTVFKVLLPQLEGNGESPERVETQGMAEGGSETMLLVEDEDMVRGLARQIIESGWLQRARCQRW